MPENGCTWTCRQSDRHMKLVATRHLKEAHGGDDDHMLAASRRKSADLCTRNDKSAGDAHEVRIVDNSGER
jgi:hypothetical protein